MKDYRIEKDKLDWIENIDEFIAQHKDSYDLYFVTFTFQNTHRAFSHASYVNTFKAFYQKLNQLTVNRSFLHPESKAAMILFREKSHASQIKHMTKAAHYHGIVLMKKDDKIKERFLLKCVSETRYRYSKKDDRRIRQYLLSDKLIKQERSPLKFHSVLFDIIDPKQGIDKQLLSIKRTTDYSTKNLADDELKNMKLSSSEISEHLKGKAVFESIYIPESVLIFCHTSNYNTHQEPPRLVA